MNSSVRWRIMILQAVVALVLGGAAVIAFSAGTFSHGQIQGQLTAQKITFPAADSAAIKALPASDANAMKQYAGQQLTTGVQAETYANHFLGVHLADMGLTYSEASAKAMANPTDTKTAALVQTLFRGETLKGLLLNAYGWWTIGTYALYAAVGFGIAAFGVFVAFLFELAEVVRDVRVHSTAKVKTAVPAVA